MNSFSAKNLALGSILAYAPLSYYYYYYTQVLGFSAVDIKNLLKKFLEPGAVRAFAS